MNGQKKKEPRAGIISNCYDPLGDPFSLKNDTLLQREENKN